MDRFWVGLLGGVLLGPFSWTDGPCKIFGVWFTPDLQLEKNWSEVLEKVMATTELWSRKRFSLKGRAKVCIVLVNLERILFQFVSGKQASLLRQEIGHFHSSEGGQGVPNEKTRRHTFPCRLCAQHGEIEEFLKEVIKKAFLYLRNLHSNDGETHRSPRNECYYRECRHDLKVFSPLQTGLSDSQPLSSQALYRTLGRGAVRKDLIDELDLTKEEGRLLWPYAFGIRCFNNDEVALIWLVIRNTL